MCKGRCPPARFDLPPRPTPWSFMKTRLIHPLQLNWLHFPTALRFMADLLKKDTRFVEIIAIAATTKDNVATSAFVDHNDKVAKEDKLSTTFEWTSNCKTYHEKYGEVYS
ncbi:hypothetical protein CTA1_3366 [Colletotrichum tanaceti]|uniref:Uncharacterized protein n=1 Tax=Colletotrichum tanaceti TaxID=1306861 RepID=A0A4U6X0S7_9PEZI|nr:hypothetical protein CTA1_3366 [Colletotrichum tanaceti]